MRKEIKLENIPILILGFRRSALLESLIKTLKSEGGKNIFISIDGPRNEDDAKEQKLIRNTLTRNKIHESKIQMLSSNLGCQKGVYAGITWFFSKNARGIILEDDCLPTRNFLQCCAAFLNNKEIQMTACIISGNNFSGEKIDFDFYESKYPHCWGWATRSEVWESFSLQTPKLIKLMSYMLSRQFTPLEILYWLNIWLKLRLNKLDSWAFLWTFHCWLNQNVTLLPAKKLVSNLGGDEYGTHYGKAETVVVSKADDVDRLQLNICKFLRLNECKKYDFLTFERHFLRNRWPALRKLNRKMVGIKL